MTAERWAAAGGKGRSGSDRHRCSNRVGGGKRDTEASAKLRNWRMQLCRKSEEGGKEGMSHGRH